MSWAVLAVALVACGSAPAPAPIPRTEEPLAITGTGFGPLTAKTPATLVGLRAALAGYEVVPVNAARLEYQVFERGKLVFAVVPDAAGEIRDVSIATPRVLADHAWRVGGKVGDASVITGCDCIDGKAHCYAAGEHVAVAFAGTCSKVRRLRQFVGLTIDRVVWRPRPFGGDASEDDPDPPGESE
jgi:hypothetical protein